LGTLINYIDFIDDVSLDFLINKNVQHVLNILFTKPFFDPKRIDFVNILFTKPFFDPKRIDYNRLLTIASFGNMSLIEHISTHSQLITSHLLANILEKSYIDNFKSFLQKFNIDLKIYVDDQRMFIEVSIKSYSQDSVIHILELLNCNLKEYKHSEPITNQNIMKILLKYNYIPSSNDFNFDDINVNSELLYKMVEHVNNPTLMLVVLLSKINKLEGIITDLQSCVKNDNQ